jgi:hypothetical protein
MSQFALMSQFARSSALLFDEPEDACSRLSWRALSKPCCKLKHVLEFARSGDSAL